MDINNLLDSEILDVMHNSKYINSMIYDPDPTKRQFKALINKIQHMSWMEYHFDDQDFRFFRDPGLMTEIVFLNNFVRGRTVEKSETSNLINILSSLPDEESLIACFGSKTLAEYLKNEPEGFVSFMISAAPNLPVSALEVVADNLTDVPEKKEQIQEMIIEKMKDKESTGRGSY